jgi:hypothetical protein
LQYSRSAVTRPSCGALTAHFDGCTRDPASRIPLSRLSQGQQTPGRLMCPRAMEARGDLTTGQGVGAMDTRKVSLTSRPSYKSLPQAVQLDMLEAGSGGSSGGPEALLLALGRSLESLPSDIANGIKNGKVYLAKSENAMVLHLCCWYLCQLLSPQTSHTRCSNTGFYRAAAEVP